MTRQIILTFGELNELEITGYAIGNSYYKPHYDKYYVDAYTKGDYPFLNDYLYAVEINDGDGKFGDEISISAESYLLGNKTAVKVLTSSYEK